MAVSLTGKYARTISHSLTVPVYDLLKNWRQNGQERMIVMLNKALTVLVVYGIGSIAAGLIGTTIGGSVIRLLDSVTAALQLAVPY